MEIRPLTDADGPAIERGLLGDPEVAAWFRPEGPFSVAECEAMAVRKAAHRTAHGFGWSLGWDGERCVGWGVAQFCIADGVSEVEIGWTVARSRWGQGIATTLGRHALAEISACGLRSIVAYARTGNAASRAVMAKLGMTYEKAFDEDGEPHVLYRLELAGA